MANAEFKPGSSSALHHWPDPEVSPPPNVEMFRTAWIVQKRLRSDTLWYRRN